jgi:sulfate adenylyltransferase (ADP) / ATP adenylyltransferase
VISTALVRAATERALASGALEPIGTESEVIDDAGAPFVVRIASSLAAKANATKAPASADPLGDYEPALFVGDVGAAHYALLNKFPVMSPHLLVVTRTFEPQERLLGAADFAALDALLAELDWLAFYNGGRDAGASQARKHLQLVPLPLAPEARAPVPLEPLITTGRLPFRHAYAPLPQPADMQTRYRELLARCGISALADGRQSMPYNLLATRRWMLVVPRAQERYEGVSLNALAFAGSLFARDRDQLERIKAAGPMNVLRAVTLQ